MIVAVLRILSKCSFRRTSNSSGCGKFEEKGSTTPNNMITIRKINRNLSGVDVAQQNPTLFALLIPCKKPYGIFSKRVYGVW